MRNVIELGDLGELGLLKHQRHSTLSAKFIAEQYPNDFFETGDSLSSFSFVSFASTR